jgi:hypothetical protein
MIREYLVVHLDHSILLDDLISEMIQTAKEVKCLVRGNYKNVWIAVDEDSDVHMAFLRWQKKYYYRKADKRMAGAVAREIDRVNRANDTSIQTNSI